VTSSDWRESPSKRAQAWLISALGFPIIAALGSTFRWRAEGVEYYQKVLDSGRQPIMAFWHGRILPATVYFRERGIVVITSENFDGEWIAGIIERFGYGTARGSTSRGRPAAFTLDGPRGPAGVAQPGAVWLAKATGNPIVPFHIESDRHWTARSWDRTQIPKPWSNVAIAIGEPFDVPADADDAALEQARVTLEARLERLAARARAMIESTP